MHVPVCAVRWLRGWCALHAAQEDMEDDVAVQASIAMDATRAIASAAAKSRAESVMSAMSNVSTGEQALYVECCETNTSTVLVWFDYSSMHDFSMKNKTSNKY